MNNVVVALISMLSGGTGLALFNYFSGKSKESSEFKMAEFKDGAEVRREYLEEIKSLRADLDKEKTYGQAWRDKYYEQLLINKNGK